VSPVKRSASSAESRSRDGASRCFLARFPNRLDAFASDEASELFLVGLDLGRRLVQHAAARNRWKAACLGGRTLRYGDGSLHIVLGRFWDPRDRCPAAGIDDIPQVSACLPLSPDQHWLHPEQRPESWRVPAVPSCRGGFRRDARQG
jgi:hypothetical protein